MHFLKRIAKGVKSVNNVKYSVSVNIKGQSKKSITTTKYNFFINFLVLPKHLDL